MSFADPLIGETYQIGSIVVGDDYVEINYYVQSEMDRGLLQGHQILCPRPLISSELSEIIESAQLSIARTLSTPAAELKRYMKRPDPLSNLLAAARDDNEYS